MKRPSRTRKLLWISAAALLAAWALPRVVRVNFWQQEVATALSGALHRPVRVGDVHLQVVGGFGLRISNVSVDENPAFGFEPFARAESVEARVALSSLWHGRVEFSSLSLISPSINIVRSAGGDWNVALLGRDSSASAAPDHAPAEEKDAPAWAMPRVRVEAGKINFKLGDRKKAYRIESLDLELIPPASPRQPWRFQLDGMPARTDLPFHAASPFRAKGEFGPIVSGMPQDTGVPLHLDWTSENAMLAELLTVITGKDPGVHGILNLRGHIAGTTSLFRISAEGEVNDLHRWDLLPAPGSASLRANLAGIVDFSSDRLELTSLTIPLGSGSVTVRGRIEDLFHQPQPRMEAELQQVPLSALAALVPQFTTRAARGFTADGALQGHVRSEGFTGELYGELEVSQGFFRQSESSPRLRFSSFPIILDGRKGRLGSLHADLEQGNPVQLSLQWDAAKGSALWQLRGDGISMPALARLVSDFGWDSNAAEIPQGELALHLDVASSGGELSGITGWARISGGVVEARGLDHPVRISDARLQFQRNQLKVQPLSAELGPVAIEGSVAVRYSEILPSGAATGGSFPAVEFTVESRAIDIADLAAAFSPPPTEDSFFRFNETETLALTPMDARLGSILDSLEVRGEWRAGAVRYRGVELENVAAAVYFHDRQMEIPEFSAEHAGGTAQGDAKLFFGGDQFRFHVDSRYAKLDLERLTESLDQWKGVIAGNVSGELRLAGGGQTPEEIVSQLIGSGEVNGTKIILRGSHWAEAFDIAPAAETRLRSFSAGFQVSEKRIHIAEMTVTPARSTHLAENGTVQPSMWSIGGEVGFDHRLDLMVQSDSDGINLHWSGTLDEPQVTRTLTNVSAARREASVSPK
ncbi:MAG: AsmA family protein [Acidobacteria bacterium]|nr:AsmA family protein [Acidobacteriota bacterium]